MASFITAGNATNGLQVSSDNTGILELKSGTGSGTTAVTVNASQNVGIGTTTPSTKLHVVGAITATQGVGGTPVFSAFPSTPQTLSSNTWTKVNFATTEFDTTGGMYASSRFTPTIAGYYQLITSVQIQTTQTPIFISFYKNGSSFKAGSQINAASSGVIGTALIYFNGSTDYVEVYANITSGQALATSAATTYFQGFMERAA
jgi:hypothetical protein